MANNGYINTKEVLYTDVNIEGNTNEFGQLEYPTNEEALNNAFRVWLVSSRGENLRSTTGGYLLPHLGKVMNDERAQEIRQAIQDGLNQEFSPALRILTLDVIPDYTNRLWTIRLVAYSPDLKSGVNTIEKVRNLG